MIRRRTSHFHHSISRVSDTMVEDYTVETRQSKVVASVLSLGLAHLVILPSSRSSEFSQYTAILKYSASSVHSGSRPQSGLVQILILNIFEAPQIYQ